MGGGGRGEDERREDGTRFSLEKLELAVGAVGRIMEKSLQVVCCHSLVHGHCQLLQVAQLNRESETEYTWCHHWNRETSCN